MHRTKRTSTCNDDSGDDDNENDDDGDDDDVGGDDDDHDDDDGPRPNKNQNESEKIKTGFRWRRRGKFGIYELCREGGSRCRYLGKVAVDHRDTTEVASPICWSVSFFSRPFVISFQVKDKLSECTVVGGAVGNNGRR